MGKHKAEDSARTPASSKKRQALASPASVTRSPRMPVTTVNSTQSAADAFGTGPARASVVSGLSPNTSALSTWSSAAETQAKAKEVPHMTSLPSSEMLEGVAQDAIVPVVFKESEDGKLALQTHASLSVPPYEAVVLLMKQGEELAIVGETRIRVLRGGVEVWGYTITAASPQQTLYSPLTASSLVLRAVWPKIERVNGQGVDHKDKSAAKNVARLNAAAETDGLASSIECSCKPSSSLSLQGMHLLEKNIHAFAAARAISPDNVIVTVLQTSVSATQRAVTSLRSFKDAFGVDREFNNRSAQLLRSLFVFLPSSSAIAPLQMAPACAKTMLQLAKSLMAPGRLGGGTSGGSRAAAAHVVLFCGGKEVGKSSLARYTVNKLLQHWGHVAVLDADAGQTELSPPGCISLHIVKGALLGPPFTHLSPALVEYFFGSSSSKVDPQLYIAMISSLLEHYRSDKCIELCIIENGRGGLDFIMDYIAPP